MTFFGASLLVVLGTLIGAWGALLFKLASKEGSGNIKGMLLNVKFITGAFMYFISTIPFLIAVKYADITSLYPIVATSYIWVILLSRIFLQEKITKMKWMGIFCIIIGITFIGLGKG